MIDSSLKDIAAALRAKTVSAVELATDSLARIEAGNGRINAFVTTCRDSALKAARDADARIAAIAFECQDGLPRIVQIKLGMPLGKTSHIQTSQLVADTHQ